MKRHEHRHAQIAIRSIHHFSGIVQVRITDCLRKQAEASVICFHVARLIIIIRLSHVRPIRTITAVESMFITIFWAVPAFMRVDPMITSGPVSTSMATSA